MENNKNILLLNAPFNNHIFGEKWKLYECLFAPVGLLYLAAPLKKHGYNLLLVDLNVDQFEKKDFLRLAGKQKFILISCYSSTISHVQTLIREIRKVHPRAVILCGGPHCNISCEYIEGSDLTCIGEAENYIVDILDRLVQKNHSKISPD